MHKIPKCQDQHLQPAVKQIYKLSLPVGLAHPANFEMKC